MPMDSCTHRTRTDLFFGVSFQMSFIIYDSLPYIFLGVTNTVDMGIMSRYCCRKFTLWDIGIALISNVKSRNSWRGTGAMQVIALYLLTRSCKLQDANSTISRNDRRIVSRKRLLK